MLYLSNLIGRILSKTKVPSNTPASAPANSKRNSKGGWGEVIFGVKRCYDVAEVVTSEQN